VWLFIALENNTDRTSSPTNIIMTQEADASSKTVNEACWTALSKFKEHGYIVPATVDNVDDAELGKTCAAWPEAQVAFDDEGYVTMINLGSKRLHRGIKCIDAFGFERLTTLSLGGTDLPAKDTVLVLQQVQTSITSVYLGGNGLGVDGAKQIGEWLSAAPRLKTLDVRYNDIAGPGMEALCISLVNTPVVYLYVEGNQIGDQGAIALAALLKQVDACQIEEVFLGANQIESAGTIALASCLESNKLVSKIYLEGNAMGLEGANAFSEALETLKGDTGLKHLFADNNQIGKEGSKRLAKALNSSTAIGAGLGEAE
jgi:hypothetical protein